MVAKIVGLAGFTKMNRRSCEFFTQGVRKLWDMQSSNFELLLCMLRMLFERQNFY